MKFSWNSVKAFASAALASGKKNAPTLMTAGSIAIGWTAVYIFWRQSKKAEAKISEKIEEHTAEEACPEEEQGEPVDISRREKFTIYLQYCWLAAVLGLVSSGLTIGANAINLSRIAELALAVQFMDKNGEKRKKLVNALEQKLGKKETEEVKSAVYSEYVNDDEIASKLAEMIKQGDKRTLFIDASTSKIWAKDCQTVRDGIYRFNEAMRKQYKENAIMAKGILDRVNDESEDYEDCEDCEDPYGPFGYSKDGEYYDEESAHRKNTAPWYGKNEAKSIMSSIRGVGSLSDLLSRIGETCHKDGVRIDELAEFHCYSDSHVFTWDDIAHFLNKQSMEVYRKRFGEDVELPQVCVIDYSDYLRPAYELTERETCSL